MNQRQLKRMIRTLVERREIALTTLSKKDSESADRLQTADVRGDDELLYWGLGPPLTRGNIVALYTTQSLFLPRADRATLRRLYAVAADVHEGDPYMHHVFLYRRVTVSDGLSFAELRDSIGLNGYDVAFAGWRHNPWSVERKEKFWHYLFKKKPELVERVHDRLVNAADDDDVAISYAGEDWAQAQRLMTWCEQERLRAFFVTSVDKELLPIARVHLKTLLERTFSRTKVAVFLVPRKAKFSRWIMAELVAAMASEREILLVRTDRSRPWPTAARKRVTRITTKPAEEGKVIREIRSLLRRNPA